MAYPYSLITGVSGSLAAQIAVINGGGAPNVVYTTGVQTIVGAKTFTSTLAVTANITGITDTIIGAGNLTLTALDSSKVVYIGNAASNGNIVAIAHNATNVMTITGAKVGIGTTAPASLLHLSGATTTVLTVEGNQPVIDLKRNGVLKWELYSEAASDSFILRNTATPASNVVIVESTGQANSLYVKANGNVGIGLTNPTSKLVVSGTSLFTDVVSGLAAISAQSYRAAVSGVAIPLIGATATGTYNIDFTNSPALQTITITGATLFSGVNYVGGGAVTMRINVSGANSVPIRFPAAWNAGWVTTVPTGLATGRFAVMTLNTFAAADTGVAVAWAVAP